MGSPVVGSYTVIVAAPHGVYQEFGFYDVGGTWHPPVAFLRRAIAEAAARWPEIAGRYKLTSPGRHESTSSSPSRGGPRRHTFDGPAERRGEHEAGSHDAGQRGGHLGVRIHR